MNQELEKIVEENLELMNSCEDGGMTWLINRESIGGNAGPNCVATNFYYEPKTGKIIEFTNSGKLAKQYPRARFIIELKIDLIKNKAENNGNNYYTIFKKIMQCILECSDEECYDVKVYKKIKELNFLSENVENNAKKVLLECMRRYNNKQL